MSSIYREPRSKWFMVAGTVAVIGLCASWVGIIQVLRTPEAVKPVVSASVHQCSQCHKPSNVQKRAAIIWKLRVTHETQAALLRELEVAQ